MRRTLRRHPPFTTKQLAERWALYELHHYVRFRHVAAAVTKVVNADDVGMTNHRSATAPPPDTLEPLVLPDQIAMQQFHCNFVTDVQAFRAKHRSHTAFTQALDQLVLGIENGADARIAGWYVLSVCRSRRIGVRLFMRIDLGGG